MADRRAVLSEAQSIRMNALYGPACSGAKFNCAQPGSIAAILLVVLPFESDRSVWRSSFWPFPAFSLAGPQDGFCCKPGIGWIAI